MAGQIAIRISDELRAALVNRTTTARRSISQYVRILIENDCYPQGATPRQQPQQPKSQEVIHDDSR